MFDDRIWIGWRRLWSDDDRHRLRSRKIEIIGRRISLWNQNGLLNGFQRSEFHWLSMLLTLVPSLWNRDCRKTRQERWRSALD
jgi:hypothetical protein